MNIRPIRDHADHRLALARIAELWGAPPGTDDGDELDVLGVLVQDYVRTHFPRPPPPTPWRSSATRSGSWA